MNGTHGSIPISCPVCDDPRCRTAFVIPPRRLVECEGCGHEYVNPVIPALAARECYFAPDEADAPGTEIDLDYLRGVFAKYGLMHCRLLDLGCGRGRVAEGLIRAGWPRERLSFVDAAPSALEDVRRRLGPENVFLRDADEGLGLDDAYDAILMNEFLEHCARPAAVMRHALDALRPGGIIIIRGLPNNRSLEAFLAGGRWKMRVMEHHFNFFNPESFARFAARFADCRILEFGSFLQPGFRFFNAAQLAKDLGLSPLDSSAGLLETIKAADFARYPYREYLPSPAPALNTVREVEDFFDRACLDYRLSPDFSIVLRKSEAPS